MEVPELLSLSRGVYTLRSKSAKPEFREISCRTSAKIRMGGLQHLMACVLVVDDDLSILQVAKMILERSGFTTLSADNAAQALTLLQNQSIDVLLTDMIMPGMSGPELIVEARKRQPNLSICCMTAYIALVDPGLDCVPLILKPFAPRQLIETVRHALEARRELAIPNS